jgi:IPT/TIG domain
VTKRMLLLLAVLAALSACGDDGTGTEGPQPALTAIEPTRGTVGTEVRIDGTSFSAAGVRVFFDELESPAVESDGSVVHARAPDGLAAGITYSVRVVNAGGRADTLANAFTAVAPDIERVNGATKLLGLTGMTVIVEGSAFGDSPGASKVYFTTADGSPIEATIADSINDWTDTFIVTAVPQQAGDTSKLWVETPTGISDTVEFRLIQSGTFSPSLINWTSTTPLPQPLQGLGAMFVRAESGATPANYVFALGGIDTLGAVMPFVYRATVQESGALDTWTQQTSLPQPVAYAATAAATVFTAALDTTTAAVVYVIGGRDTSNATVSTVHFARVDLAGTVGAWQTGPSLPAARHAGGAAVFRGYVYYVGGSDSTNNARTEVYRARIQPDGTLAPWEATAALPVARSHFSLTNFGPYLYAIGGETASVLPILNTLSGTETSNVHLSRINLRTGELTEWAAVSQQAKARSKHSAVFAGGALFVTSGVYAGQPGSSENAYAAVNHDGTIASWNGATGSETIESELAISLYNQAAVTFIDASGAGHVLVLGGANRAIQGRASAAVLYY